MACKKKHNVSFSAWWNAPVVAKAKSLMKLEKFTTTTDQKYLYKRYTI